MDAGDEPVELTKELMTRRPFVWPTLKIPIPFGNTPLYDQVREDERILTAMPFTLDRGDAAVGSRLSSLS